MTDEERRMFSNRLRERDAEIERLRAALQAMMDGEPNAAQMAARALEPKP